MQRLEVSGAVRHIYVIRRLKVKTVSATAVQRAFRLRFNIQRWYLKI
jgi:hypothetical protein